MATAMTPTTPTATKIKPTQMKGMDSDQSPNSTEASNRERPPDSDPPQNVLKGMPCLLYRVYAIFIDCITFLASWLANVVPASLSKHTQLRW
eukprot:5491515-Amphidinium_carterae.1